MDGQENDSAVEPEWTEAPRGDSLRAYRAEHRVPGEVGVTVYHLRIEEYPSLNHPDITSWHVKVDNGNLDMMQHGSGHDRGDAEQEAVRILMRFLRGEV